MKIVRIVGVLVGVAALFVAGGCGSSDSTGPVVKNYGKDANGIQYAGAAHCLGCHGGFRWSEDVALFERGRHVIHSKEINAGDAQECLDCHSPVADSSSLEDRIAPENVPPEGLAAVTCEACHGAGGADHGAVDRRALPGDDSCTDRCHIDGQTTTYPELAGGPAGTCVPGGGTYDAGQVIYDTHYKATAGDWTGEGGVNINDITGPVMEKFGDKLCLNCHNPHVASTRINLQWNISKHADKTAAGAWAHYNWTHDGSGGTSDRTACQKCKTSAGIIAFTDAAKNGTEYTPPLPMQEGFKPEMLLCYGCHENNRGVVRNPGPVVADYKDASGNKTVFPDLSDSNLCTVCHAGRSNGQKIKDADFASDIAGKNFGNFNSHYLAAAGIIYKTMGYEFDGQNYANPDFYRHNTIGTPNSATGRGDAVDTGSHGPCVGCHMQGTPANHRYSPLLIEDLTNPDAEPVGLLPFCGNCHNITDPAGQRYFDFEEFEHQDESFKDALLVLEERLGTLSPNPIFMGEGYPYFFSDPVDQSSATRFTAWPNKETIGAAFNLALLSHEPGAFAHNRFYTKRLIFDAIDFLDNGVLDGVITVDAAVHPLTAAWLDGDAEVEGIQRP